MTAKLQDYEGYQILNFDESPFYPFKNRGKVIIERSAIGSATWKEKDPKSRVTFGPVVQFSKKLGFKSCFVVPVKQTLWKHKPIKIETNNVYKFPYFEECHNFKLQKSKTTKKNMINLTHTGGQI